MSVGIDAYVTKPIDPDDVHKVLKQYVVEFTKEPLEEALSEVMKHNDSSDDECSDGIWNFEKMSARVKGKEKVIKMIINSFIEESAVLLTELRVGLQNSDANTVKKHLHTLKGTSANISATEFNELCVELEVLAKQDELTVIEEDYEIFEKSFHTLKQCLLNYLEEKR